ncbi:MAG: phospholipid carrier-dependent glycosyltransferase [Alphaproteobacteria bacterium]|jgi:4-amino-4-deoxy-L-arabinose transferase-like glycosyltransferase|nr:phospholipid carrier-dependent glycosyltransferase [Alphaproteobacteria bacterium]
MTDNRPTAASAAPPGAAVAPYADFALLLGGVAVLTLVRLVYLHAEVYPLHADEAQYWSWALDPDFGYYSKPPMLAWLIWLTTATIGDGEFGVRLASPLVHAVTAIMVFLSGRALFDARIGLWAGLTYATLPAVSLSSIIASTDAPLLMFWSIALFAFIKALQRGGLGWWGLCGLALGLAFLSKYAAIAFVGSAALYLLLSDRHRPALATPGPYLALAIALALLAPNLAWNAAHGWLTIGHVGENAALGGPLFHPDNLADFLGAQFGVFGPILFAVLLVMLARAGRLVRSEPLFLLLSFVVPMLAVISVQALLVRAHANWAAPVYVAATLAVVAWLEQSGRHKLVLASLALHLVAAMVIYGFEAARPLTGLADDRATDPARRVRGWDQVGPPLAGLRARYPDTLLLSDERRYLAHYIYEARVPLAEAFKWDRNGRIDDHYEMIHDLNDHVGRDFLFVTRWGPREVPDHFDRAERLPDIVVPTHSDSEIALQVWLLEGFRGYDPPLSVPPRE